MRRLALFLVVLLIVSCSQTIKKQIEFSDGKIASIEIEEIKENERSHILQITYANDQKVRKEATVEREVQEIWNQVKTDAEQKEIEEALIKYIYLADFDDQKGKPIYRVLLFEATRYEDGKWSIRKVN